MTEDSFTLSGKVAPAYINDSTLIGEMVPGASPGEDLQECRFRFSTRQSWRA